MSKHKKMIKTVLDLGEEGSSIKDNIARYKVLMDELIGLIDKTTKRWFALSEQESSLRRKRDSILDVNVLEDLDIVAINAFKHDSSKIFLPFYIFISDFSTTARKLRKMVEKENERSIPLQEKYEKQIIEVRRRFKESQEQDPKVDK